MGWLSRTLAPVVLCSTPVCGALAADRCAEVAGRVAAVEEQVEVASGGGWNVVGVGEPVCVGEVLRAGGGGRGAVILESGAILRLDRGTTLRIERESADGSTLLRLLSGVASFFSRRPHALEVDTPFANAAVEGTEFAVAVEPDRARVTVLEGRVRVSNPQGAVGVNAGSSAVALAGKAPEIELGVRPRDAVRWALYYPPLGLAALPAGADPATREAARLAAEGRRAEALARLDAVPPSGRDPSYLTLRAGVLLGLGRGEEAGAALAEALTQRPDDPEALALRAVLEVARNERGPALADARRAVAVAPDDPRARLALSYAAQADLDIPLARASLEAAVKAAPDDALVWARLAQIRLAQGDTRAAHRAAERAVALDPSSARVQAVAGFADLARLDVRGAKAAFGRALTLDSADPQAHLGLGLATIRGGQLAAGRQQIELAVALDPDNALLRTYLGLAYMQERREKVAGDELGTAERLDPNDPTPWFYDGLRKDRDNRPGLALGDVERAMALSEARGVYRSQSLLGQDEASRGAGLAQIYTDLGFEASGRNVAGLALAQDPLSGATHRFLADIYRGQPRYESARVSELLQAQLLQPLSAEPLQPSLSFANLDLARQPLFATGFNEYTSLLQGDGLRLRAEGEVGSSSTWGEEVAIGSLFDRVATSIGQSVLHTDGFRKDFNLDQSIEQAFIRIDPSELLSVQAELRQLNTHEGSRVLTFDPNDPTQVNPTQHQDVSLSVYRVGARLKLGDAGDLLVSAIESDRDQNIDDQVEAGFGPIHSLSLTNDTGHQVEAMISDRSPLGFLRAGGGVAEVNRLNDSTFTSSLGFPFEAGLHNTQDVSYAYVDLRRPLGRTLDLELRFGYDSVEQTQTSRSALTPGAGLLWHPSPAFLARVAAGRVLKRPLVVNQTIAPVELAGFDLVLDEFDATLSDQVGVAAEYRPVDSLRLGVELEKRWLSNQDLAESGTVLDDQKELYGLGYVYWLPFPRLAVTLAAEVDRYRRHWRDTDEGPIRVDTLNAPLSLRYFDPSGLFAGVTARLLAQRVSAKNGDELQQNDSATNPIVDAEIGYRLAGGGATATLSVNNLFDRDVRYQDAAFRTEERDLPPQFLPARTILGSVTLSF